MNRPQISLHIFLKLARCEFRNRHTLKDAAGGRVKVERDEQGLQLAEALAKLPDAQREALELQHWHSWPVARIAEHMGRSKTAVAGLLKRGWMKLREELNA